MRPATRSTLLAIALALAGCDSEVTLAQGEAYRVPEDHDLQNTFAADFVRDVYGTSDSPGELGLVFTGEEVASAIPGFRAQVQGYIGPVDSSPSVVVRRMDAARAANFTAAWQDNLARIANDGSLEPYLDGPFTKPRGEDTMFDLHDAAGSWSRTDLILPGCYRTPARDSSQHFDRCSFRMSRNGYDLMFSLSGENVARADAFADYVLARLAEWRVP